METQFWWLYDVVTVAVLLVSLYLCGKKGIFKSAVTVVSCIVGILLAVPMSSAVSESIYKTAVRDSSINKLDKSLIDAEISSYLGNALENMGYSVIVSTEKIDKILESDKDVDEQLYRYLNNINGKVVDNEVNFRTNLNECYSEVMEKLISGDMSRYAVETASRKIRDGGTDFGNLMKMIKTGEQRKEVAKIISDEYTADAYRNVIRLLVCLIIFAVVLVIGLLTAKSLTGGQRESNESTGSHIAGGVCGIFSGAVIVFMIAVALRLYAVMGSNEILYFNNQAIDKTFVFRYAYDIASEL